MHFDCRHREDFPPQKRSISVNLLDGGNKNAENPCNAAECDAAADRGGCGNVCPPTRRRRCCPLVANNRPYRDFARGAISSSEDAIEQAKAWLYLPLFVTNFSAKSEAVDWSAMHAEEGWYVTAYMRNTFVWLLMDEQGRVQAYDFDLLGNASLTYDGALPDNLDEAISSYIRRFADLNGFVKVADYAREEVTTFGDYAVAVTVQVTLDGTPYRFTMRLDMMAFTSVENANLHPTAAQTQRDILLLMRDNLAEKGRGCCPDVLRRSGG